MRVPELYWTRELKEWPVDTTTQYGVTYMPRPLGLESFSLRRRLRLAWFVFIGKYDAVRWSELP